MAEKFKQRALLWDLHDTIGTFPVTRISNPELASPITLRYGIRDLLNEFSPDNGYSHYITSSGGLGHVTEALNRAYLKDKFSGVFGDDTIKLTTSGKHYKHVLPSYSEDDIKGRAIVIGDNRRDKPVDIGGLVFIELGTPEVPVEALVIREIVTTILDKGDGNFKNGYEKLYDKDVSHRGSSSKKQIDIGNDISFGMEYRLADEVAEGEERRVPVICDIKSDSHSKPFETFF